MTKNIKKYILVLLTFIGFVFAQPENFEYNQSRFQAFYLYLENVLQITLGHLAFFLHEYVSSNE